MTIEELKELKIQSIIFTGILLVLVLICLCIYLNPVYYI